MQETALTQEQEQANQQLLEQLQRIPVMQKHIQILERQGMQQRSEIAELAAANEQMQQQLGQLQHEAQQAQTPEVTAEQDENSES